MNAVNKRKSFAVLVGVLLSAGSMCASAKPTVFPDFSVTFDAGLACPGFPLTIDGSGAKINVKEFTDENGLFNVVYSGKGYNFRLTNATTGKSVFQKSQGSHQENIFFPDGTLKQTSDGAVLLVMFPTDIPAGPSTRYINGRTVLSIAPDGVGTLEPIRGHVRDICAELS